jgi:hypothetical protein
MFFGLFGPKRRTSRPKRRTSGNRGKRKTSRKPFKGTVRKGYIKYKGLTARTASGRFAGRVKLQRSALVEYPTADQFVGIARQRQIPKHAVDQAFGHMMKEPKNKPKRGRKTSARKTSRRRSSRRRPPTRRRRRRTTRRRTTRKRRVRRNPSGKRTIQRDYISVPTTTEGHDLPFSATIVDVPEAMVGVIGARRAIGISVAGEQVTLLAAPDAMRASAPWVTKKEFRKAFGHLLKGSLLGDTVPQKGIPHVYGPRVMKLGHVPGWHPGAIDEEGRLIPRPQPAKGDVVPGIVPGQLILFHKPSGQIVWQAWDDEDNNPKKPLLIKYGGGTDHFGFDKAVQGARFRGGGAPVGAQNLNIPPMAMLEAFDYLLTPASRKRAYEQFVMLSK